METGPRLKVSSDRLQKPGIKPVTPGLQGKWLIHYTTAAPINVLCFREVESTCLNTEIDKNLIFRIESVI